MNWRQQRGLGVICYLKQRRDKDDVSPEGTLYFAAGDEQRLLASQLFRSQV